MTYPMGVRSVGLAILAVTVVGCAAPYAYYGDNSGRAPCSLSGRYATGEGAPAGDCAGGDCAVWPAGRACAALPTPRPRGVQWRLWAHLLG